MTCAVDFSRRQGRPESRTGALAAIYRHIGEHAKIGVGYNFTDFSHDLTDLSYRSRGPFLNVLSTF